MSPPPSSLEANVFLLRFRRQMAFIWIPPEQLSRRSACGQQVPPSFLPLVNLRPLLSFRAFSYGTPAFSSATRVFPPASPLEKLLLFVKPRVFFFKLVCDLAPFYSSPSEGPLSLFCGGGSAVSPHRTSSLTSLAGTQLPPRQFSLIRLIFFPSPSPAPTGPASHPSPLPRSHFTCFS